MEAMKQVGYLRLIYITLSHLQELLEMLGQDITSHVHVRHL